MGNLFPSSKESLGFKSQRIAIAPKYVWGATEVYVLGVAGGRVRLSIFLRSALDHTPREDQPLTFSASEPLCSAINEAVSQAWTRRNSDIISFCLPGFPFPCVCMYMFSHFALLISLVLFCLSWSVNTGLQAPRKIWIQKQKNKSRDKIRKCLLLWMRLLRINISSIKILKWILNIYQELF